VVHQQEIINAEQIRGRIAGMYFLTLP
jgi:hypothetical protein